MRWTSDFKPRRRPEIDDCYDPAFDADLIRQSIAKQYGVLPTEQGELPYPEWALLVSGLMDDTPLGRVVAVRSEKDRKVIEKMGPWQRKLRSDWQRFAAKRDAARMTPAEMRRQMDGLERAMARMFGG